MTGTAEPAPRPRGRPRDQRIDEAVRVAVRELLAEVGYASTTMQEISSRSGVSLPAMYRRWPSKADLVEFALLVADNPRRYAPDADVFDVLRIFIDGVIDTLSDPVTVAALPGLTAELHADADARARMSSIFQPSLQQFDSVVAKARARGLLATDMTGPRLRLVIVGIVREWALGTPQPLTPAFRRFVYDFVVRAATPSSS